MNENCIAKTHPDCLKFWDYEKNVISPTEISFGSAIEIYWRCQNDPTHSYKLSPNIQLAKKIIKCPQCRSFAFKFPDLLKYWNKELNTADPYMVKYGSPKLYWFNCPNVSTHPPSQLKPQHISQYSRYNSSRYLSTAFLI